MTTFYGTAADFITYHESRGKTILSSWTTAVIEAALLVASEWLDGRYRNFWVGYPTDGYTQERLWPREGAYTNTYTSYTFDSDEIPDAVEQATYEAAFRELNSSGSLEIDFTPSKYSKVSVDKAVSVTYDSRLTEVSDFQVEIQKVQQLMLPLIDPQSTGLLSTLSGAGERL